MTSDQGTDLDLGAARRTLRRAAFLTAGAGIGYGLLSIIAWYLLRDERTSLESGVDPYTYLSDVGFGSSRIAGLYLLPFAAILFLWFIVALRGWIRGTQRRRNMLISDLQLVSGAVFTAVFLVGAGAVATSVILSATADGTVSAPALLALSGFGHVLIVVMGIRMAAIFVMATASLGMTTGVLPRWFSYLSYGFGLILMLAPVLDSAFTVAFPIWVMVLSGMLMYHVAQVPDDALPGFARRFEESQIESTPKYRP